MRSRTSEEIEEFIQDASPLIDLQSRILVQISQHPNLWDMGQKAYDNAREANEKALKDVKALLNMKAAGFKPMAIGGGHKTLTPEKLVDDIATQITICGQSLDAFSIIFARAEIKKRAQFQVVDAERDKIKYALGTNFEKHRSMYDEFRTRQLALMSLREGAGQEAPESEQASPSSDHVRRFDGRRSTREKKLPDDDSEGPEGGGTLVPFPRGKGPRR